MPNDICLRHPDAKPQRSHLGRYCPECLRESFANHERVETDRREQENLQGLLTVIACLGT